MRCKLVLLYPYNEDKIKLPVCNLILETEDKIYLELTFIQWFVTQSKLSLIFNETILFPHKTA